VGGRARSPGEPWREIMPLLGWGGGFASQVWYTYWVLGRATARRRGAATASPPTPALSANDPATAEKISGWCRVVYVDATIALVIGSW